MNLGNKKVSFLKDSWAGVAAAAANIAKNQNNGLEDSDEETVKSPK